MAALAYGIYLVDEYDRRRLCTRFGEEVSNSRGTNSDAHLDKARAGDRKNGTPTSPARARAKRVLPVPGGPVIETPLGEEAPAAW